MRKKVIFIRSTAIGNLMDGSPKVGGIAVQLYFWAKTFVDNGCTVYTMSPHKAYEKESVCFLKYRNWGKLDFLHEWLHTFCVYLRYRPDLVMERGAGRSLYPVAKLAKRFHIKMVLFGASDVNYEPGKELISGGERNKQLFRKGIPLVSYFVVQNQHQHDTLKKNYGRKSMIMPNIWGKIESPGNATTTDVVWIANLRPLKRPEWVLSAAKALPNYTFTMVGGPDSKDLSYYESVKNEATAQDNVSFMGSKPFLDACDIVSKSKVLVCTSTFEGFPNTFLQAWSYGIPVVSTVDPSGIIASNKLGVVITSEDDLPKVLQHILGNSDTYESLCHNVKSFFAENYSSNNALRRLLDYCEL